MYMTETLGVALHLNRDRKEPEVRTTTACTSDDSEGPVIRWVRLHEKGGKEHDIPCHHISITSWTNISQSGIAGDANAYLRTTSAGQASLRKTPCTSKTPTA
jgi:hypothetical protein